MANLKEVRTRIQSVKSTQQITKAMKMVAASKLRKAQDAILQMRPYAKKLYGIFENAAASLEGEQQSEYGIERDVDKVLIVVITSDRGLCGAFNSNVIKEAIRLIEEKRKEESDNIIKVFEEQSDVRVVKGKYGPYIKFGKKNLKIPKDKNPEDLTFEECVEISEKAPAKKRRFNKK